MIIKAAETGDDAIIGASPEFRVLSLGSDSSDIVYGVGANECARVATLGESTPAADRDDRVSVDCTMVVGACKLLAIG